MSRSEAVLYGDSWLESDQWLHRARRLGPLRYSDLGPRRSVPIDQVQAEALAHWIAGAADRWWEAAGRPDPYTLVVVSGDTGVLARAVLLAAPDCLAALRYVIVNPWHPGDSGPPASMAQMIPLEEPAFLYPTAPPPSAADSADPEAVARLAEFELDLEFGERPPARGIGPLATFLTEVPALGDTEGAVVAVETLSRLPYELFELREEGWAEIRLAARGDWLVEMAVPLGTGLGTGDGGPANTSPPAVPDGPPVGGRPRWRRLSGAADWLRRQLPAGGAGVLAVVDHWSGARPTPVVDAVPGESDGLDLEQLRQVREPLAPVPEEVAGSRLSAVTWRLG